MKGVNKGRNAKLQRDKFAEYIDFYLNVYKLKKLDLTNITAGEFIAAYLIEEGATIIIEEKEETTCKNSTK